MNSESAESKWVPHNFGISPQPRRKLHYKAMMAILKVAQLGAWWASFAALFGATGGGCLCCALPVCTTNGISVGVLSAFFAWCAVGWKKMMHLKVTK